MTMMNTDTGEAQRGRFSFLKSLAYCNVNEVFYDLDQDEVS
jgi:hypothetical protein